MPRLHLFEFEDLPWFPRSLRNAITDSIQFGINLVDIYSAIGDKLEYALRKTGARRIIDLGSGGGGPWPKLWRRLAQKRLGNQVYLSDLRPNNPAMSRIVSLSENRIAIIRHTMDATKDRIPSGFRTMFSAFHHFDTIQARAIIENATRDRAGIGIFELTSRAPVSFLLIFAMPLMMLLLGAFIRPFRFSRIFWIYIVPAAPVVAFFDGIVSCLRSYSVEECERLIGEIPLNGYFWQTGIEKSRFLGAPITYIIGYPGGR